MDYSVDWSKWLAGRSDPDERVDCERPGSLPIQAAPPLPGCAAKCYNRAAGLDRRIGGSVRFVVDQGRLMNPHVRIARNVLAELARVVSEGSPALSTGLGDLFPSATVPVAAVRLNIPAADYLAYLSSLPTQERPSFSKIVPVDELRFHIVINGFVNVENGRTAINGKLATIL